MILYKQDYPETSTMEMELAPVDLKKAIEKTHQALDAAYAGFNNATDFDMIDSYIYEINAIQRRYKYLTELAEKEGVLQETELRKHSPVRAWVARIFR